MYLSALALLNYLTTVLWGSWEAKGDKLYEEQKVKDNVAIHQALQRWEIKLVIKMTLHCFLTPCWSVVLKQDRSRTFPNTSCAHWHSATSSKCSRHPTNGFTFLPNERLRMLPAATEHRDLYSAQLSKRTPRSVRLNFKRIGGKVEQEGIRYLLCSQQVDARVHFTITTTTTRPASCSSQPSFHTVSSCSQNVAKLANNVICAWWKDSILIAIPN